ncbi:MAG: hypothetical protein GXP32_02015 [Kiritimatiellaeota bacterium]|nr:hypothetical protein [Kiritimatiellota bacterium]
MTNNGRLEFFIGEGRFTDDVIPPEFFGCAGVAEIAGLQSKLREIGYGGYRHHVSVSTGYMEEAVREAFVRYLGYDLLEW